MSEDRCAGGVQPLVTIRVVEMPVSIDELLDGIGADRSESLGKLRTRTGEACIDQQLSVRTWQNRDISTGAHQDADVAAQFLNGDVS